MSTEVATVVESPVSQALGMIERAARDQSVDIAKMQTLQEMQFRLLDRHAIQEWHEAVASLPPIRVEKNGTIDLGSDSKGNRRGAIPFARWEDMDTVLRPLLGERGLFLTFDSSIRAIEGGGIVVTGTLRHRSSHFISASIALAIDTGPGRNNLQAMGSALAYGKRYTAEMLLNIVRIGVDDDSKTGGMRFITAEQVATLRQKCEEAGRAEDYVLSRAFKQATILDNGQWRPPLSFEEVQVGGFEPTYNSLEQIIHQNNKRKGQT